MRAIRFPYTYSPYLQTHDKMESLDSPMRSGGGSRTGSRGSSPRRPSRAPAWAGGAGDVKLMVCSKDEFKVTMTVHRRVLAARSRFFAEKLGREAGVGTVAHSVEICDCDDVGVYVEVVVLMYWEEDLRRKLVGEDVGKVLSLLKVCFFSLD